MAGSPLHCAITLNFVGGPEVRRTLRFGPEFFLILLTLEGKSRGAVVFGLWAILILFARDL